MIPTHAMTVTPPLGWARLRLPGCLVLDVSLPDLTGLDLQKRLGNDRSDLPITFITGYGDIPMTLQAMKGGGVVAQGLRWGAPVGFHLVESAGICTKWLSWR